MWIRAGLIVAGAAVIGSILGTIALQLMADGGWTAGDWRVVWGFSAFTLIFTIPGSMLLALIFAHIQYRYESILLAYGALVVGGGLAGGMMLLLWGTWTGVAMGASYGVLTGLAWVALHRLTERPTGLAAVSPRSRPPRADMRTGIF